MKMTTEQFKTWSDAATFSHGDHIDGETAVDVPTGYTDDGETIDKSVIFACAWRTLEGILPDGSLAEITYSESVEWNSSYAGRIDSEYKTSPMENADTWLLDGVNLVDEDGDCITGRDLQEFLGEVFGSDSKTGATDIDYAALLPEVQTEDIDLDKESDMETIIVQRDNDTDIRFNGEEIASVSSKSAYNDGGRWTVLKLWKTKGGKFICQSIGRTQWQGETDRFSAAIADDEAGVIDFFKHGRLAKELYSEANIDDVQSVD